MDYMKDFNAFLPSEVELLVLRYLATSNYSATTQSFMKESRYKNLFDENEDNIRATEAVLGGLRDFLQDFGLSLYIARCLFTKMETEWKLVPEGTFGGRDSLKAGLRQTIKSLTETFRSKPNIGSRSTQTSSMATEMISNSTQTDISVYSLSQVSKSVQTSHSLELPVIPTLIRTKRIVATCTSEDNELQSCWSLCNCKHLPNKPDSSRSPAVTAAPPDKTAAEIQTEFTSENPLQEESEEADADMEFEEEYTARDEARFICQDLLQNLKAHEVIANIANTYKTKQLTKSEYNSEVRVDSTLRGEASEEKEDGIQVLSAEAQYQIDTFLQELLHDGTSGTEDMEEGEILDEAENINSVEEFKCAEQRVGSLFPQTSSIQDQNQALASVPGSSPGKKIEVNSARSEPFQPIHVQNDKSGNGNDEVLRSDLGPIQNPSVPSISSTSTTAQVEELFGENSGKSTRANKSRRKAQQKPEPSKSNMKLRNDWQSLGRRMINPKIPQEMIANPNAEQAVSCELDKIPNCSAPEKPCVPQATRKVRSTKVQHTKSDLSEKPSEVTHPATMIGTRQKSKKASGIPNPSIKPSIETEIATKEMQTDISTSCRQNKNTMENFPIQNSTMTPPIMFLPPRINETAMRHFMTETFNRQAGPSVKVARCNGDMSVAPVLQPSTSEANQFSSSIKQFTTASFQKIRDVTGGYNLAMSPITPEKHDMPSIADEPHKIKNNTPELVQPDQTNKSSKQMWQRLGKRSSAVVSNTSIFGGEGDNITTEAKSTSNLVCSRISAKEASVNDSFSFATKTLRSQPERRNLMTDHRDPTQLQGPKSSSKLNLQTPMLAIDTDEISVSIRHKKSQSTPRKRCVRKISFLTPIGKVSVNDAAFAKQKAEADSTLDNPGPKKGKRLYKYEEEEKCESSLATLAAATASDELQNFAIPPTPRSKPSMETDWETMSGDGQFDTFRMPRSFGFIPSAVKDGVPITPGKDLETFSLGSQQIVPDITPLAKTEFSLASGFLTPIYHDRSEFPSTSNSRDNEVKKPKLEEHEQNLHNVERSGNPPPSDVAFKTTLTLKPSPCKVLEPAKQEFKKVSERQTRTDEESCHSKKDKINRDHLPDRRGQRNTMSYESRIDDSGSRRRDEVERGIDYGHRRDRISYNKDPRHEESTNSSRRTYDFRGRENHSSRYEYEHKNSDRYPSRHGDSFSKKKLQDERDYDHRSSRNGDRDYERHKDELATSSSRQQKSGIEHRKEPQSGNGTFSKPNRRNDLRSLSALEPKSELEIMTFHGTNDDLRLLKSVSTSGNSNIVNRNIPASTYYVGGVPKHLTTKEHDSVLGLCTLSGTSPGPMMFTPRREETPFEEKSGDLTKELDVDALLNIVHGNRR